MKAVFGDTVYFLALVNPTDQFHRQALVLSREPPAPLVTTEWVLTSASSAKSSPSASKPSESSKTCLRCQ